jgi:hypothetical protein
MIRRICLSIAIVAAVLTLTLVAFPGHRPLCCKGYAYWDLFEAHGAGHRWRKVTNPVTMRSVPITPSIWNIPEAQSRALLVMMANAQRQAGSSKVKVRSWDAICWHYGEPEPMRLSWPVQP